MIKKWRKSKGCYDNKCILLSIIIVVAVICGLQLSEQSTYISSIGNIRVPASTLMNTRDVTKDYYPKVALPEFKHILNHEAVAGNQRTKVTPKGHGKYKFNTSRDLKRLQMPFVMYNGVKYRCKINKKHIKTCMNKKQLLIIKHVPKGTYLIRIYNNSIYNKNDFYLSMAILIILLIFINICISVFAKRFPFKKIKKSYHDMNLVNKVTNNSFLHSNNKLRWLTKNPDTAGSWMCLIFLIVYIMIIIYSLFNISLSKWINNNHAFLMINVIFLVFIICWIADFQDTVNYFKRCHHLRFRSLALLGKAGLPYISLFIAITPSVAKFLSSFNYETVLGFISFNISLMLYAMLAICLGDGIHYLELSQLHIKIISKKYEKRISILYMSDVNNKASKNH